MKIFEITKHLNRGGRARILALSLFILILSVFSCANDAVIDDFTNPVISDSAEKIVFSGSLNIEGTVPGALSKISNESEVTGRSAFPSLVTSETSDVKYYISARATGPEGISEEIKGSVDQTAKSYSIGLTIGRTYTVTASLKKTLTGGQQVTIMEDEWENVTPSRTNTSLTHDFILKPVEGGDGSIKLKMTLPTGIDCPSLSGDEIESTIQFHDDYTTATATISVDVIPAGTYNITINFYKSSGKFLLYSIPQTINVFAGMETNTWQDDGSSNSPISAGKFVLTDEIIKNYQRTIFYVSEKDFTGKAIENGQTRTGSPYAPFASLSDALNTIANNNKAEDYKIFIGGSLTGNTQISTLIKAENAKSLIIEGFTGNSSDCLVGDGSGSVLSVGSSVPLTIKNLKITGGNAEKGGGINIGENAVVFLGNDLIVSGNKASGLGGGVYAPNGVNVNGNVEITGNTDSASTPNYSNLYLPSGKKVNVTGALTNGSKKAQIGISTAEEPSLTNKIAFTLDYGKYNSSVAPGTYFIGDKWTVTAGSGTAASEACLAASGGNIIIEPVYEDITISIDKTAVLKSAEDKTLTFTVKAKVNGSDTILAIGNDTEAGQIPLTYAVTYHGETVPASFYTVGTGTNANKLTLGDNLPLGDYMVSASTVYNGKTYGGNFPVNINNVIVYSASEAVTEIANMTGENTIKLTGSELTGLSTAIKKRYRQDKSLRITLDLSDVEVESLSKCCNTEYGIKSIILPSSLKSFRYDETQWGAGYQIEAYIISDTNQYFSTQDGVLYNKNKTDLILYPRNKADEEFTLPSTVTSIKAFAMSSSKVKKINGLAQLKSISEGAFESVAIEEADLSGLTITDIGMDTLRSCTSLKKVILSSTVSSLGFRVFYGCSSLTEIHFKRTSPPSLSKADGNPEFSGCNNSLKFYVPTGSKSSYTNSTNFTNSQYNYFAGSGLADRIIEE